jgi:hypothetical protein
MGIGKKIGFKKAIGLRVRVDNICFALNLEP